MAEHPMQPVIIDDDDGIHRFKRNAIVCYLIDRGPITMNDLAIMAFSREDHEQFAQLIGYSVSGFGELSYASKEMIQRADRESEALDQT